MRRIACSIGADCVSPCKRAEDAPKEQFYYFSRWNPFIRHCTLITKLLRWFISAKIQFLNLILFLNVLLKQMRWVTAPDRTILCALLLLLLAVTYVVASHESHSTNRRNGSKGRKRNGGRSTTTTTTASPQFEFLNETSSSFFDGDDEDDVEAAAQHQQDQPPGGIETCEVARLKCAYRVGCGMALQVRLGYMSTTHFFIFVSVSNFVFSSDATIRVLECLATRENVSWLFSRCEWWAKNN